MDLKIVFDLLKEVREDQKHHGIELAKQSAYLQNMDSDVKELKETVSKNTEDIAHHISRTDGLQDLYQSNEDRIKNAETKIEKLEEPVKAKEWLKKHMVTISAIVTALASIAAFLIEKFGK